MRLFSILDRYIGKIIYTNIIMALFMMLSLSSIIKFIDQLKKIGQGHYETFSAGIYTLLSMPKDVQIFFPMATLLGALLGLGILVQHNELIVMQASGYTRIQIVLSVIKTSVPLVVLIMVIGELAAPRSEQLARNYRARAMYGGSLLSTQQGLWAKDGRNFVHIEYVKGENELGGVSIYVFNEQHRLQSICYAVTAKFNQKHHFWQLLRINESNLQDPKQIISSKTISSVWKTKLTPDKLDLVALDPDSLSIRDLFNYIKYLKSSGQDTSRYQLGMWNKIFQPILVIVMILMALSLIFGPLRGLPMGICVVIGIIFGFILYMLNQVFSPLTLIYDIPPILGALLPSTLFFFVSIWFLLKSF